MQSGAGPRPSLLSQPSNTIGVAPRAHPVRGVDLSAQMLTFHNIHLGVLVWRLEDPGDVRSLRLLDLNRAAERELGMSAREAVGKVIAEAFPALMRTDLPERCRTVVASGKPESIGEVRCADSRDQDSVFWFDCFPLSGNCVGTVFENITERKRIEQTKVGALRLLHKITIAINGSTIATDAAQVCLREVCQQIGWPVGRLFLIDEHSATRFVPNPIWYFSDAHRFEGFRQATEMFEQDLTNKFVLDYRMRQGKKAGLTRSVGFWVLEGNTLRAVLEFSSETAVPLDEALISAIGDIGVQLGRVFEREGAALVIQRLHWQDEEHRSAAKKLRACTGRYGPSLKASLERLGNRKLMGGRDSAREVASSIKLVQRCLAEMRDIGSPPVELARTHRLR
jgi:hypothetical protein